MLPDNPMHTCKLGGKGAGRFTSSPSSPSSAPIKNSFDFSCRFKLCFCFYICCNQFGGQGIGRAMIKG